MFPLHNEAGNPFHLPFLPGPPRLLVYLNTPLAALQPLQHVRPTTQASLRRHVRQHAAARDVGLALEEVAEELHDHPILQPLPLTTPVPLLLLPAPRQRDQPVRVARAADPAPEAELEAVLAPLGRELPPEAAAPRRVRAVAAAAELLRVPLRPGHPRPTGRRVRLQVEGAPDHAEGVAAAARVDLLVEGYGAVQADLAHVALYLQPGNGPG